MLRRRVCTWSTASSATPATNGGGLSHCSAPLSVGVQWRGLKTLDVREYRPLGTPIEFRFYQRYANHPNRQSGIQFLTHYNTHQRFRVNKDFIDYLHWGKEQGQARLPHRHQRVAFDFHDLLHPTRATADTRQWFAGQDATLGPHPDIATDFNPDQKVFSNPEHWNRMFSKRRPGEGDIQLGVVQSNSLLGPMVTHTDTQKMSYFHTETRGPTHGRVPGLNAPYHGEMDRQQMQSMSRPLNKSHTITGNDGRFSKTLYINDPQRHQALTSTLAKELNTELDRATNGIYSKLTVLTSAQSGQTDFYSSGTDLESIGFDLQMAQLHRQQAAALAPPGTTDVKAQHQAAVLQRDADRYLERADTTLRENAALLWRVYTSPRPLMTLVNGKCRGTGCGLALASKYCGLQDASEFVIDGPNCGLTPYTGVLHLLARRETAMKYPGLAEFVLLSGTSLFSGDALRLGWSDLFTTLPDMAYHIKDWFNNTEHMHDDAVAWQLGSLLESCFKMKTAHSSAMERVAMTPIRARWVEDAFADQSSVEEIIKTLSVMEKLPFSDTNNTSDASYSTPYTLSGVAEGIERLEAGRLRYSLSPWDITAPESEVVVQQAATLFTSYVLERRGTVGIVVHKDRHKMQVWRDQREREYEAYTNLRSAPHPRHVYARLEGCEGQLVDFDFVFDPHGAAAQVNVVDDHPTAALEELKRAIKSAMGMPEGRDVEIAWYLPTLDTCPIHHDADLVEVLHNDPGFEDPSAALKYPPVYFLVKRNTLHLSEWAYAVKHQLLLQSPFALKATFALLQEARGDGSTAAGLSTFAASLAAEYRYIYRLMQRADFYSVGQHIDKSAEQWADIKEERQRQIHRLHRPVRPLPDYEAVFERDVTIDGHSYVMRPRWSPRTLAEVPEEAITALRQPLDFWKDGTTELDVGLWCNKASRVQGMVEDAGGYEVVPGLGEVAADGSPKVAPLRSNAEVPTNVSFYEMARHPWEETPSSWRTDGFTKGSKEYFERQYKQAEKAVYDETGRGVRSYWPSRTAVEGSSGEDANQLLEERLFGAMREAEREVEPWARQLRTKALDGKLDNRTEIATQQEKIYDDEYYRWFIQPDHHPNPSGLLRGRRGTEENNMADRELDAFLHRIINEVGPSTTGTDMGVGDIVDDVTVDGAGEVPE